MNEPLYLDNAATTPMLPEVAEHMRRVQVDDFGNPSSTHSFGARPARVLDDARDFMRGALGAGRLVLTSGGSEADLLGIAGAALARKPGRVLACAADHDAVLAQRDLLARLGYELVLLAPDRHGVLTVDGLAPELGADVRCVAILHGHNELGTLANLDALVPAIRSLAPDAHIHVDAVQAFGKVPFDLESAGVDSVAVSAHKFHGPRGVGCLALSNPAKVVPLQPAGGQEAGIRGGTENVAGAAAMARAAEIVLSDTAQHHAEATRLAAWFCDAVSAAEPDVVRLGDPDARLPQVISLRLPGLRGQTVQEMMAAQGIAFSTGSACHSDDQESDNHVLKAIGLDRSAGREVIRISLARSTTEADLRRCADALLDTMATLRTIAPSAPDLQT